MLYGFLVTLFVIACFLLVIIVLAQKGKGSMGLGAMGGGSQVLFGGSGGQDFFQKATWILGAIFMFGSLGLGLMKSHYLHDVRYAPLKQEPSQTDSKVPMSSIIPQQDSDSKKPS